VRDDAAAAAWQNGGAMTIEALRTPDERFADLPDFPWEPRYTDALAGYEGLRMHYLDEGPKDAPVFLCLHGEPSWSYLYRKMIPPFLASGARVVAPDFFGFGRSDKPVADAVYTFSFHRDSILRLVDTLDLQHVTLVVQDWGGLVGLTLPLEGAERYERLLIMNTALATGHVPPSKGFIAWRDYVANTPDLDVGKLMGRADPAMPEAVRAAYDAPFPDDRYKAGVRRFPAIVPTSTDMEGAAISQRAVPFWTEQWDGPTFMAVGVQDPVLGPPVMNAMRGLIKGCPEPLMIEDAGHFVQERGDIVAKAALEAWK
jgi:pimeloyl-ACP methyl ester carboxylesterase